MDDMTAQTSGCTASASALLPAPMRHGARAQAGGAPAVRAGSAARSRRASGVRRHRGRPAAASDCHAGHLVCPVPNCPDPRLIARGGSRRDHFAHRHAAGTLTHAPEVWYHLCGKSPVGQWARQRYPEAWVQVDHEA